MRERPAEPADLAALVDLWCRFETATSGAPETDEAAVRVDWDAPGFSLERSTLVVEDGAALVGYAVVDAQGGCDSVAAPERPGEGIEDRLLDFLEARPGRLQHYWGAGDEEAAARFTRRGWQVSRTFWRMRRELSGELPAPVWPPGVAVREMAERDGRVVHEVVQTAFADVGDEHLHRPYDDWAAAMLDPQVFDAGLCLVAEQDGEPVGVCLAQDMVGAAFIRQLAVPRAHRGRGTARALLLESFRRHAARGYAATVLGVDAANETGALRLYAAVGMREVEAFTRWERPG